MISVAEAINKVLNNVTPINLLSKEVPNALHYYLAELF